MNSSIKGGSNHYFQSQIEINTIDYHRRNNLLLATKTRQYINQKKM